MKRKAHEHENHERWLVSYADFITLLFAFFVVMYATSTQNTEKEKKFENSIRENFKLPSSPGGGAMGGNGANSQDGEASGSGPDKAHANLVRAAELQEKYEKKISEQNDEDLKKIAASLRHDAIGVRMSLAASSFFPSGSAKIKPSALRTLNKLGELLKNSSYRVLVEGHTDDQPVAKDSGYESNWELGSARATQVVRYLAKVSGVDPQRMAAMSYADQRPLVKNTSEENRAKNRRIEILILTGDNPYDDF